MSTRLYKRGDIWWGSYYQEGKRIQKSTHCTDKAAAETIVRKWERDAADPLRSAQTQTTIEQILNNFLLARIGEANAGRKSQATVVFYRDKAGHWLTFLGREYLASQLKASEIDRFIAYRRSHKVAENTIAKELITLRAALRFAKRRMEWAGDTEALFPSRFAPEYKPKQRWLSPDELKALMPHLWLDHAARMAFIVATSACMGETIRARREDIRGEMVLIRGTKRKTRWRTVPLVAPWQKALMKYALQHAQGTHGLLFVETQNFQEYLKRACEKAKIAPCSPNDLRRTCATWLRSAGVPLDLIAAVLGHADSTMVERVYGRLEPDILANRLRQSLGIISEDECNTGVTDPKETGPQMGHMDWWQELPEPRLKRKLNYRNVREKKVIS